MMSPGRHAVPHRVDRTRLRDVRSEVSGGPKACASDLIRPTRSPP
jgi:hypothetical protein